MPHVEKLRPALPASALRPIYDHTIFLVVMFFLISTYYFFFYFVYTFFVCYLEGAWEII